MSAFFEGIRQRSEVQVDLARALYDDRYRHQADREGDKRPKKDAASVRSLATSTVSAAHTFERLLPKEDAETLQRAAGILRMVASDLDILASISKAAKLDRERRELEARHARADQAANARWTSDEAMRMEAVDLAAFVDVPFKFQSLSWVHSIHPRYRSVRFPNADGPGRRLTEMLNPRSGRTDPSNLRREAAEYLLRLQAASRNTVSDNKESWQVGLDDYEAWREWRKQSQAVVVANEVSRPNGISAAS